MDAGRQLVSRAMSDGVRAPVVYVSANYRVNGACLVLGPLRMPDSSILFYVIAFGFLAGSEIAAEGGLNAGLLDRESIDRFKLQSRNKLIKLPFSCCLSNRNTGPTFRNHSNPLIT